MLQRVALVLKNNIRSADVVARLGGEEFVIMLPATTKQQAADLAETLRACVDNTKISYNDIVLPVTASFGVSSLNNPIHSSVSDLYVAADKALYTAKKLGQEAVPKITR